MTTQIRGITKHSRTLNLYDVLGDALIRRLPMSEENRIQQVLSGMQLGSTTSSQLLRRMRLLVSPTFMDDTVPRQLWLQRLPPYSQSILECIHKQSLENVLRLQIKH